LVRLRQEVQEVSWGVVMGDRAALEREMEEIRAQLDWVRDYL
jgi:hypothetical protein